MFACLSRICAVATSDKTQQFAIGDGAGGFYLLSLVGLPY
jgi:predicted RNA-binding protein with PIN domain